MKLNGGVATEPRRGTANGTRSTDSERPQRIAAAALDLIRSGERSLRVLQLGGADAPLAPLCADDEVAEAEVEGAEAGSTAERFDCAVSVDRLWRLSGSERTEHLEALRASARIVLVEAPLNGDSVLEDAGRFFEELGDWTALVSEERLAELHALSALEEVEEPGDAIRTLARALDNLTRTAENTDRAVLVSVTDESAPGFDLESLRRRDSGGSATSPTALLAGALPVALEMQRAGNRSAVAERRAQELELTLARRAARLDDLASKLAEATRLASDERRLRRRAERELEVAKGTRGYRLGLRIYRIRTRIRAGARSFAAAVVSPLRRVKRRLRERAVR